MQASNEEIKKVNEITKDQLWEKFCQECSEDLKCPIRREPFTEDPVTLKGDGRVYEKKEIEKWLKDHDISPWNRAVLSKADQELVSFPLMKSLVATEFQKFKEKESKKAEKAKKKDDHNEEVKVETTQDIELLAFNYRVTSFLKKSPGIDLFKMQVIGNDLISELMHARRRVFYLLKVVNMEWKDQYGLSDSLIKETNKIIINFISKCGFPPEEMGLQMASFFGSEVSPDLVRRYPELCTALLSLNMLKEGIFRQENASSEKPLHYDVDLGGSEKIAIPAPSAQSNNNNNAKISKFHGRIAVSQNPSSFFKNTCEEDKTSVNTPVKSSIHQQFKSTVSPCSAEYDYFFKIKLYGDNSVGKSCLLSRWTEDRYTEAYISTIGIDSKTINIKLNDKTVKMQIWDTNISAPKSAYERGFHAVIFVVDITDRLSLINLDKPLQKFKKENMPNTNKILVVSKADLENERQLEMCELEAYAQQHGMVGPIVTSAKTGQGVNLAFEMTAKVVLERITKNNSSTNVKSPSPSPSNNDNNNNDNNEEQSCLVM